MPSAKKVIALRLDDETTETLQKMAAAQRRSVANLAEVLIKMGLEEWQALEAENRKRPARSQKV